jgi:hypothetical protein
MLDAKLEQWINDFEAKFYDIDDVNKKSFIPTELIYDLRHKSTVIATEKFKTESRTEEVIYCYIPSSKPELIHGYVLKREDDKTGSIASYINYVSYGYISLDKFITNYVPLKPKEESKIKKYILPAFLGAIIPVTYIGVKRFFEKKKEKERRSNA